MTTEATTQAAPEADTETQPVPSLGLRALLLIRLDGRLGEYVSVDTLAQVHRLSPAQVRAGLVALHVDGYVRCRLGADGLIDGACSMVRG